MNIPKAYFENFLWFGLAILVLLVLPLSNGYPLLFSDSGTYIISGHIDYAPVDRPITYGLFIRHLSLSWRLWLVVIIQAAIFNYCLFLMIRFFAKLNKPFFWTFIIALCLSIFTGISYFAGQLTADIFTSITVLSLFLIYYLPKEQKIHLAFLSILFGFSLISHLSHLPISLALIGLLLLFELFKRIKYKHFYKLKRLLLLSGIFVFSILTLSAINYYFSGSAKLSRASNIVIGARLIETGIANQHLKRHCNSGQSLPYGELCDYIDQFDQWPAAGFYLHDYKSPLYAGDCLEKGWTNCWLEKDSAYQVMISDILAQDDFLKAFAGLAVTGTLAQFFSYELDKLEPLDFGYMIERHYPDEKYLFEHSTQKHSTLTFDGLSFRQMIFIYLSFIVLLYILLKKWKILSEEGQVLLIIMCFALVVNAFVCATFSNVVPRYQARIIFLLPLVLMLIVLKQTKQNRLVENINLKQWI